MQERRDQWINIQLPLAKQAKQDPSDKETEEAKQSSWWKYQEKRFGPRLMCVVSQKWFFFGNFWKSKFLVTMQI